MSALIDYALSLRDRNYEIAGFFQGNSCELQITSMAVDRVTIDQKNIDQIMGSNYNCIVHNHPGIYSESYPSMSDIHSMWLFNIPYGIIVSPNDIAFFSIKKVKNLPSSDNTISSSRECFHYRELKGFQIKILQLNEETPSGRSKALNTIMGLTAYNRFKNALGANLEALGGYLRRISEIPSKVFQ